MKEKNLKTKNVYKEIIASWKQNNKPRIKELNVKYYVKNKEAILARAKETRARKGYIYQRFITVRSRARKYKRPFEFTFEEFASFVEKCPKNCIYCGVIMITGQNSTRFLPNLLSIDRIDNEKGYTKDNVQGICMLCNNTKSSFFTHDEMLELGSVIKAIKSRKK